MNRTLYTTCIFANCNLAFDSSQNFYGHLKRKHLEDVHEINQKQYANNDPYLLAL